MFSALDVSLMEVTTTPVASSGMFVVLGSDFLIHGHMSENFSQIFYLRSEASNEMTFLDEFLSKPSPQVALVQGSPGSGKSLTVFTWAWIKSQQSTMNFVFLCFVGSSKESPFEFRIGYFKSGVFKYFSSTFIIAATDDMSSILKYIRSLKLENPVLILDGLTKFSIHFHIYLKYHFERMIFVTSQQIFLGDPDKAVRTISFTCYPWKMEDYEEAVKNDLFWSKLSDDIFDTVSIEKINYEDRCDLIRRKFYFAGISARWMFRTSWNDLPLIVQTYAYKVKDIESHLSSSTGDKSDDAVNHILMEWGPSKFVIVSPYATRCLALLVQDSSKIAEYIKVSAIAINHSQTLGIAYEVHIRNLINKAVSSSVRVKESNGNTLELAVQSVTYYKNLNEITWRALVDGEWFFPASFLQGGFDMFQLLTSAGGYKVRFLQVTIAAKHSFREQYLWIYCLN